MGGGEERGNGGGQARCLVKACSVSMGRLLVYIKPAEGPRSKWPEMFEHSPRSSPFVPPGLRLCMGTAPEVPLGEG